VNCGQVCVGLTHLGAVRVRAAYAGVDPIMTLREHQVAAIRDLYFRWQDRMAAITRAYNDKDPNIRDVLSAVGELWDLPCRSGKTRAALTVLYHWQDWLKKWSIPDLLLDDWLTRPNLVLAPSFMVRDGAWVEDWAHVCPDWDRRAEVFGQFQYTIDTLPGGLWPIGTLTPSKMRFVVKSLKPNDILVITYDTLRERADIIASRPYGLLVADEIHMLKNPRAQWTQAAYQLESVARLGLSATPFTNYVHELIHVLRFLQGWTAPWGGESLFYLAVSLEVGTGALCLQIHPSQTGACLAQNPGRGLQP